MRIAPVLLGAFSATALLAQQTPRTFRVNAGEVVGSLDNKLWANLGYDPLYVETTARRTWSVLRRIRESRAFRYVRCHNALSDGVPQGRSTATPFGCHIYSEDENGAPRYNWWHLDHVYDLFLSAGLRPIVEMDFMPDALAEGEIVRNYSGGAVNTPKDYEKWRQLCYEFVKHCEQRYGPEEVRQWYFEIWNEPDLSTYFIDGWSRGEKGPWTPQRCDRLNKMYDYFVAGATAADPQIKVGGPGLAGNEAYFRAFLEHVANGTNYVTGEKGTRIDFISWHGYGRSQQLLAKNRRMRAVAAEFPGLEGCEFQQNEWGEPLRIRGRPNRSPACYTSFEAAFLCQFADGILSDPEHQVGLFLKWGRLGTDSAGRGWRTLTRYVGDQLIVFPIFNAYDMLSKMGPERLAVTGGKFGDAVHAFAARSGPGSAQVLVYNFDEGDEAGQGEPTTVTVEVTGLGRRDSDAPLKHYRIDRDHANPFGAWAAMGRPQQITPQQAEALRQAGELSVLDGPGAVPVKNGAARISFSLPINAVSLIVIGAEPKREWQPSKHVQHILDGEKAFQAAQEKAAAGDTVGALQTYERVVKEYADCFWSQEALRDIIQLREKAGDAAAADAARKELLSTPLVDAERLKLLETRLAIAQAQSVAEVGDIRDQIAATQERLRIARTGFQPRRP